METRVLYINDLVGEVIKEQPALQMVKVNGANTTHFIYDTQYRVIEERDGNRQQYLAGYLYLRGSQYFFQVTLSW